eukprot:m.107484 g.107484  ORF g.107484 m.107484 type:complete len:446 (-) comp15189_c0_seq2:13-1350(-)
MDPYSLSAVGIAVVSLLFLTLRRRQQTPAPCRSRWTYSIVAEIIKERKLTLPCVLVDLHSFDANCLSLAEKAERYRKTIRMATKSVRVPALIARALKLSRTFQGLMCYNAREALFLYEYLKGEGIHCDDFLVAYPTVEEVDIQAASQLTREGVSVALMIDCIEHIQRLDAWWQRNHGVDKLRVCMDLDMSWKPLSFLHLGAHRSPVRSLEDVRKLYDAVYKSRCLELVGVMGYEAQISGVPDANPFTWVLNPLIRVVKRLSFQDVLRRRRQVSDLLREKGVNLQFFNGGGTGSLLLSASDASVTEVTAGSGLLQSQIFDWFTGNENDAAFVIALRCTRSCDPRVICCHSGGFIASGQTSNDKSPQPFLPPGAKPFPNEGFGEVQTPLLLSTDDESVEIGDPVFVRPAKAGEIAERFNVYHLLNDVANPKFLQTVPTYRGMGMCFF